MSQLHTRIIPVLVLIALIGCGKAGELVDPGLPPDNFANSPATSTGPATGDSHHSLLSYQMIFIEPDSLEFEIIPLRLSSTHFNVLTWLENAPCDDCLQILNIEPSSPGIISVDINISHPFADPGFTGFDVRGIAMFNGTGSLPISGLTYSDSMLGDAELLNADGFTTLYNFTTEGAGPGGLQGYQKGKLASVSLPNTHLNGFKRFVSEGPDNIRNAFYSGDSITNTYEIKLPAGPFVLGYAVDANWAVPLVDPVTDPQTDFPDGANCQEAWKIEVTELPYGTGLTDSGGETRLIIDVYDYQGSTPILVPVVECPELFYGAIPAVKTGEEPSHTTYTANIVNRNHAPAGTYKCWISVEDISNSSSPGWLNLTSYQMIDISVGESEFPEMVMLDTPWLGFWANSFASNENYLFVSTGYQGCLIFDILDPENPEYIGKIDPHTSIHVFNRQLFVQNNHLFVLSNVSDEPTNFRVYDISNIQSPQLVTEFITYAVTNSYVMDGWLYGSGDQSGEVSLFDIDPPGESHLITSTDLNGMKILAGDGDFLYLGCHTGIAIYDVSNPLSPQLVGEVPEFANVNETAYNNGYLYLLGYETYKIIDVDPPGSAHVAVDDIQYFGIEGISVSGGLLYILREFGLDTYSLDNPEEPQLLGTTTTDRIQLGAIIVDGYLYTPLAYQGMACIDVTDPALPAQEYVIGCTASEVFTDDSYLYVVNWKEGIGVMNLPVPDQVTYIMHIPVPGSTMDAVMIDGYIITCDANDLVQIVDIDPVESASAVGSRWIPGGCHTVAASGGYVYAGGAEGITFINIENPSHPYIAHIETSLNSINDLYCDGNDLYVSIANPEPFGNLVVFDITDPLNPIIHAPNLDLNQIGDLVIDNGYGFSSWRYHSFSILDVDPLDDTYTVRTFNQIYDPRTSFVDGGYCYVADYDNVQVIDLDPIEDSHVVSYLNTKRTEFNGNVDITRKDNHIYLADTFFGVRIIELL